MKFLKVLLAIVIIFFLILIGYHFLRKNHFISKEEVIANFSFPESKFIDWNGKKIHVIERGSGVTVLLIHGLGASLNEFEGLSKKLAENYKVVSFDLPGFGLSDVPEDENPDFQVIYSDFMHFILDKYASDSCYLIGNSMGGLIAWNTVLEEPTKIKKMVLLAPAGYDMEKIAKKNAAWVNTPITKFILAKGAPKSIAESNVKMCFYKDDEIDKDLFKRKYAFMNKEGNLDFLKKFATYNKFTDTALIKTINCPTLVIWGDKDEIIPFEHAAKFKRDLPNSQLIVYKDCGHVPQIEEAKKCTEDIQDFLK